MSKSNLSYAGQAGQNQNTSDLLGLLAGKLSKGGNNRAPVSEAQPSWSRY